MALTQISTGGIKDDAVTDAKLPANSVGNSEMKDDAVGVAELSASGTASSSTFLRGDNTFTAIHEVGASTTYEPTGSFKNQAFILHEGSNYTFTALEGGTITKGLIAGEIYPISISKIVTGGSTVVKLLK